MPVTNKDHRLDGKHNKERIDLIILVYNHCSDLSGGGSSNLWLRRGGSGAAVVAVVVVICLTGDTFVTDLVDIITAMAFYSISGMIR